MGKLFLIWSVLVSAFNAPDKMLEDFKRFVNVKGYKITQMKTLAHFVSSSSLAIVGLTSAVFFSGVVYPDSEHFVVTAIRAYTGTSATLTATAWTPGITDAITQNGSISLNNNGTNELVNFPLTQFTLSTNNADSEAGLVVLEKPILWAGQTKLTITAEFLTAVTTATQNLRFELIGMKLI